MRISRAIACVAVATCAVLCVIGPVRAQEGPPRPPTEKTKFGLRAANFGKTTLEDGHFAYTVAAGSTVQDAIELINYSDDDLVFTLYPADMGSAIGGGLAPVQRNAKMEHAGKWITFDDPELATVGVSPKSRKTIQFTLRVPKGTPPGDYPGAIVAALDIGRSQNGLGVQTRGALLVRLNVVGKAHLKADVRRPRGEPDEDGYRFEVDVANKGNVLFTMSGEIEVRKDGEQIAKVPLSPKDLYVIPDGEATLTGRWNEPPLVGRVKVIAHIHTSINREPVKTFTSEPMTLTIVPWRKAATAAAMFGLPGAALFFSRKRIRGWRVRRRETREIVRRHRAETASTNGSGTTAHEPIDVLNARPSVILDRWPVTIGDE